MFSLKIAFDASASINLEYVIDGAIISNFNDTYTDPDNSVEYDALQGTINDFITPTDFTSEQTMADPQKIVTPKVAVVLQVVS